MPSIYRNLFGLFRNRGLARPDTKMPENLTIKAKKDIVKEIAAASTEGIDVNPTEPAGYLHNRFSVEFAGVFHAIVKFNFSGMAVNISHICVNDADKKKGFCRAFVQNLYRASQREGFERIELTATQDGRFVWAALGFRPTDLSWVVLKRHILKALEAGEARYPKNHLEYIRQITELDKPGSLPVLADLPGDIAGNLSPVGIVCTILMSGPTWQGEISIGDPIVEKHLFG